MDHLPYPPDPATAPVQVPFCCENTDLYDGGSWKSFPERVGWTSNDSSHLWLSGDPEVDIARAQSWMFFGLLELVFGPKFNYDAFTYIDQMSGRKLVTTAALPGLLEELSGKQKWTAAGVLKLVLTDQPPPFVRVGQEGDINDTLQLYIDVLRMASQELCRFVPASMTSSAVLLSIRALIWSLRNAIATSVPSVLSERFVDITISDQYLNKRMVDSGICPYWIDQHSKNYSVGTLNYVAAIRRPQHVHSKCNRRECLAHNVDMSRYETSHVSINCTCGSVHFSQAELVRIIEDGGIPLVKCSWNRKNGIYNYTICEAAFGRPYTAISHVWSGGLGNPKDTSLPECQVSHLTRLLSSITHGKSHSSRLDAIWENPYLKVALEGRKARGREEKPRSAVSKPFKQARDQPADEEVIYGDVLFWMDTLCIPVGTEHTAARAIAINQMARVYAGADQVLVLDPAFKAFRLKDQALDRIGAHILMSAWMSRCWTYQEARLAQKWVIAVSGGFVDPFDDFRQCNGMISNYQRGHIKWNDENQLLKELCACFYSVRPVQEDLAQKTDAAYFASIWNELSSRMTTYSRDLHGILANMLDLNAEEVMTLPVENRTKAILKCQKYIPASLLLAQATPTQARGGEWVPPFVSGSIDLGFGVLEWMEGQNLVFDTSKNNNNRYFLLSLPVRSLKGEVTALIPYHSERTHHVAFASLDFELQHLDEGLQESYELLIVLKALDGNIGVANFFQYSGIAFEILSSVHEYNVTARPLGKVTCREQKTRFLFSEGEHVGMSHLKKFRGGIIIDAGTLPPHL
jgi:hypothetical protein